MGAATRSLAWSALNAVLGIGLELSTRLAAAGATVVLACRNEEKAKQAVESIKKITGKKAVSYEILDVSSQASVRAFVNVWDKRPAKRRTIDFLLLNAGSSLDLDGRGQATAS